MASDPIGEVDIQAYLDGELDLDRKLAVEVHLSRNPEAAARVMEDFRARTALGLLHQCTAEPSETLREAANRLSTRLGKRPMNWRGMATAFGGGAGAVAAGALLMLSGPQLETEPPAYVADAVAAYQIGLLRAAVESQPESPRLDIDEIRRSMRIHVPPLPAGWQVTDVQIFPSNEGPALQIMIRMDDQKDVSMFAVRSPSAAPLSPVAVRHGKASVAYWRHQDVSYALTGVEAPEAMDLAAESLAQGGPS